jgi:hypothetical protein
MPALAMAAILHGKDWTARQPPESPLLSRAARLPNLTGHESKNESWPMRRRDLLKHPRIAKAHDWSDEDARTILTRCRAAMPQAARLLVLDNVDPGGNVPSHAKWLDLLMLVYVGGRERTETEFRDLFASAGFTLGRVLQTASNVCILEAIRDDLG